MLKERLMSKSNVGAQRKVRRAVQALVASLVPMMAWAGPVDINQADAATIARELQGVGLSRAQAIVDYREKNGAFKSVDDLRKVKGVGARTLELNRANIRIQGSTAAKGAG
jgi:competence protein ComEA